VREHLYCRYNFKGVDGVFQSTTPSGVMKRLREYYQTVMTIPACGTFRTLQLLKPNFEVQKN
jgi:hypothetical protein